MPSTLRRMVVAAAGLIVLALPTVRAFAEEPEPLVRQDADGKTTWYDARGLTLEGKGWAETEGPYDRLPAAAKGTVRDAVWSLSKDSAGMAVRFRTDAPIIRVHWTLNSASLAMPHMPATGVSGVDLYARMEDGKWLFAGNGRPGGPENEASFGRMGAGEYTLYLPLYNGVSLVEIGVPNEFVCEPLPRPEGTLPVVFYGTSITQGGCASRPGMAATNLVARALDVPIINLGFSGSALMEPELAELLCQLEARVYVLDPLHNMSPELAAERYEPFVRRLREAHPTTPILLVEDCNVYNTSPTARGMVVRPIYERLQAEGMTGLRFLSALGMLGDDGEGTVDRVHPNDLGMARQAEAFEVALRELLGM
jgi:hypothetical protein